MSSKLQRTVSQGMTVAELKDILECYDDDVVIGFAYNYGDHWNSQVVQTVRECEMQSVEYSKYHRMLKVAAEPDEDDVEEEATQILVLE